MEVNRKQHLRLRLQGATFTVLFLAIIALLAWLSTRYAWQADWTAAGRHSLAPASIALLAEMPDAIRITAFARASELLATRRQISDLVRRYQQHKRDIDLHFIDPDMAPDEVRREGVRMDGEMIIEYQGRKRHLQQVDEQALTNILHQLVRATSRKLVFLEGHGERNPEGAANHDLGSLGQQLRNKGLQIIRHNLSADPQLPEEVAVLVIAGPQTSYFPGEVHRLQEFVEQGGNLLWLAEPDGLAGLEPLAAQLGINPVPGIVVDPTTQLLGIDNAAFSVVVDYPDHPLVRNLDSVTLFPFAMALDSSALQETWQATPILQTVPRAWSETGSLDEGAIRYDPAEDVPGPLTLGLALERASPSLQADSETLPEDGFAGMQRLVVIGDGDFLSNAYLGNGANLELGERLINWLSQDDALLSIPPKVAMDTHLEMTPLYSALLGFGFLLVIPGGLVLAGLFIWLGRRKR